MQAINKSVSANTLTYLKYVGEIFGVADVGQVVDMYFVLRDKGAVLPDLIEQRRMAAEWVKQSPKLDAMTLGLLLGKRVMFLRKLKANAYVVSLCDSSMGAVERLVRLLKYMRMLWVKNRRGVCADCSLLSMCELGRQNLSVVTDPSLIVDKQWRQKIHVDCPQRNMVAANNMLDTALDKLNDLTKDLKYESLDDGEEQLDEEVDPKEAETVDGGVKESSKDENLAGAMSVSDADVMMVVLKKGQFKGSAYYAVEKVIEELSSADMQVFQFESDLTNVLSANRGAKTFEPVVEVAEDMDQTNMRSLSDLTKAHAKDLAMPEEVIERKALQKELTITTYSAPESKKQLCYLLVDNTGSMNERVSGGAKAYLTRRKLYSCAAMCKAVARALSKKLKAEGGWLYSRFFDVQVTQLTRAIDHESYDAFDKMVALASFNGGGTNILHALKTALDDIKQAKDELASAEILVLTDADDNMNGNDIAKWAELRNGALVNGKPIEVSILDMSGKKTPSKTLIQAATKYFLLDAEKTTAEDLFKLV